MQREYVSFFIWIVLGVAIGLVYSWYFGWSALVIVMLGCLLGVLALEMSQLDQEAQYFKVDGVYVLNGRVESVQQTGFGQCVTLKSVKLLRPKKVKLKHKVQIWLADRERVTPYDELEVEAKDQEIEAQMNPSDLNKKLYLKGKNIVAILKGMKVLTFTPQTPFIEKLHQKACEILEETMNSRYVGIMEAMLVGDESKMPEQTKHLYKEAGISHLLCISGFHVGVVAGLCFAVMGWIVMPYTIKQLMGVGAIIGYTILTGSSPSTVRASLMLGTALVARCLWQEDDRLTNLAIAAGIILLVSPYQLYMPGFQLSFMAVLGIIVCLEEIEKKQNISDWKYPRWQQALLIWGSIQLMTWPILAYHFYEVAFGLSVINLLVIPVFSWLIIGGWLIIGFGLVGLPISVWIARSIEVALFGTEQLITYMSQWPLAHLCVGRPSLMQYIVYGALVLVIGAGIWQYISQVQMRYCIILLASLLIVGNFIQAKPLGVNGVYVGQGDSSVIEIPDYGVLVIDGGNYGKGKTVENYVKYLGYGQISGVIVSHSDADHMGGVVDLIQDKMPIKQIFLPQIEDLNTFEPLVKVCERAHIPISYLKAHESFRCGQAKVTCLAPIVHEKYENGNDTSVVCQLEYGNFSALFTGDKSVTSDEEIYDKMGQVTLLKVSHHGSRTGTSKGMLLNLRPRYAMISCGQKNRYGHPHQEVIDLLKAAHTQIGRTDKDGLIRYETDGTYLRETKYRKDA